MRFESSILGETEPATIIVPVRRAVIVRWLWWTTITVYLICVAREAYVRAFGTGTILRRLQVLNLNAEAAIPAAYSALLLFVAAGLLAAHAMLAAHNGRRSRAWWALSAIFVYLSFDENASIHEIVDHLVPGNFGGALTYRWVIVAAPILLVTGAAFLPFLFRLPRPYGLWFVLAGLVYVGGAFGMEIVGGYIVSTWGNGIANAVEICIEEGMEMAGATLFISILLSLLASERPRPAFGLR